MLKLILLLTLICVSNAEAIPLLGSIASLFRIGGGGSFFKKSKVEEKQKVEKKQQVEQKQEVEQKQQVDQTEELHGHARAGASKQGKRKATSKLPHAGGGSGSSGLNESDPYVIELMAKSNNISRLTLQAEEYADRAAEADVLAEQLTKKKGNLRMMVSLQAEYNELELMDLASSPDIESSLDELRLKAGSVESLENDTRDYQDYILSINRSNITRVPNVTWTRIHELRDQVKDLDAMENQTALLKQKVAKRAQLESRINELQALKEAKPGVTIIEDGPEGEPARVHSESWAQPIGLFASPVTADERTPVDGFFSSLPSADEDDIFNPRTSEDEDEMFKMALDSVSLVSGEAPTDDDEAPVFVSEPLDEAHADVLAQTHADLEKLRTREEDEAEISFPDDDLPVHAALPAHHEPAVDFSTDFFDPEQMLEAETLLADTDEVN